MADVTSATHIHMLHGKTHKHDRGYFYETANGKQKYRTRREDYQQNRSPKQLWHTQSFVWAHAEIRTLFADTEQVKRIEHAYRLAMRRTPDGRAYMDAKGWKFAMLQLEWKQNHPFEQWYETYLQQLSQQAAEKTASEDTSEYMLRRQIEALTNQLNSLKSQLANKRH